MSEMMSSSSLMMPAIAPQYIEMVDPVSRQLHVNKSIASMFGLYDQVVVSGCISSWAGVNGNYVIEMINSSIVENPTRAYLEVSHADEDKFSSWENKES